MEYVYIAEYRNSCGTGKTVQAAKSALIDDLGEDLDYEEIAFFKATPIKVKVHITIEGE